MKKYLLILSAAVVFFCSPVRAQASSFMAGFEDLPLMDGLKQAEEASVSFDTPSGRIIEAYAESEKIGKQQIVDFYDKTLPQLGWKRRRASAKTASPSYVREGEELTISIEAGAPIAVRFELTTK